MNALLALRHEVCAIDRATHSMAEAAERIRAREIDYRAMHEEFQRKFRAEMQTPEYIARKAEEKLRREENLAGWWAFASAGGGVANNLKAALVRTKEEAEK